MYYYLEHNKSLNTTQLTNFVNLIWKVISAFWILTQLTTDHPF